MQQCRAESWAIFTHADFSAPDRVLGMSRNAVPSVQLASDDSSSLSLHLSLSQPQLA